jgi:hypothetical protein
MASRSPPFGHPKYFQKIGNIGEWSVLHSLVGQRQRQTKQDASPECQNSVQPPFPRWRIRPNDSFSDRPEASNHRRPYACVSALLRLRLLASPKRFIRHDSETEELGRFLLLSCSSSIQNESNYPKEPSPCHAFQPKCHSRLSASLANDIPTTQNPSDVFFPTFISLEMLPFPRQSPVRTIGQP